MQSDGAVLEEIVKIPLLGQGGLGRKFEVGDVAIAGNGASRRGAVFEQRFDVDEERQPPIRPVHRQIHAVTRRRLSNYGARKIIVSNPVCVR